MSFFDDASLAFLPSGAAGKDGKAYSIKPTDGTGDFTFSRGSNLAATRVGADGLIEKGRENLLLQSNQFDTTWNTSNAGVTSGQSGYDGSSDAWKLESTTTGESYSDQTFTQSSGVQTLSFYAKQGNASKIRLVVVGGGNPRAHFDLSDGTIHYKPLTIDAQIEAIGATGWYRCSVIFNAAITQARIQIVSANDGTNNNSAIGDYIYIQDAQLEIGLAATDYIESGATTGKAGLLEDEPRFDYSGGATCPSLLLEPSRTQYILYTEYLDPSTNWAGFPSADPVTHTQNYAIAPDGTKTASLLGNFTSGGFNVVTNSNYRATTGVTQNPLDDTYTMSVWLKTTSGTGTITLLNRGLSSGTNTPQSLQCNVTNEWQRFDVSNTYTAAEGAASLGFIIIKATSDTLEEVLVWGAQTEAGTYPTSYIPNHSGGTITRGADLATKTGVSDLIGQTEGTLYWEGYIDVSKSSYGYFPRLITIGDGTSANFGGLLLTQSNQLVTRFVISYSNQANISSNITTSGNYKIAFAYAQNDFALYVNGVSVGTDTSGNVIGLDDVYLGYELGDGTAPTSHPTKQALLFKTRLSNADLETLTTL